jgi:hypothetical protein
VPVDPFCSWWTASTVAVPAKVSMNVPAASAASVPGTGLTGLLGEFT